MWNAEPKQSERNGCDASQGRRWGLPRGTGWRKGEGGRETNTEMLDADADADEDADSDSDSGPKDQSDQLLALCSAHCCWHYIFGDSLALSIGIASADWRLDGKMMMTRCD